MKTLIRLFSAVVLCGVVCLLNGCQTTSSEVAKRPPQSPDSIEVFRDDTKPSKPYREIGTLKDDGKEIETKEIEKQMIRRAAKMGGNAIIFDKPTPSGFEAAPFSFGKMDPTFLFKGTVVVYE
jgi:hypothetical protein